MLVAIAMIMALIYLRERPQDEQIEGTKPPNNNSGNPIGISPPMGFDVKSKQMYSPLTTPVPGTTYMKNPRIDPVPSIYNTVLNVDEKGRFDEQFFKKRQIYTNWDDMEEHLALDNIARNDFPMRGAPLINGLNRKEIIDPVSQYGMFTKPIENKLTEEPWM
jgi:hypothetical protein